ncbi:chaperonin: PROVISIONAL [Gigaspora margarita]|uniref:Chaperonin: PROVISIONAL n=1 Tax=Gigaspora margarita TaxID=4874 RepID=A0A8H3XBY7_GIGMA|nr:chaperonin: PROVISIONAL [Gigaspora margarita]
MSSNNIKKFGINNLTCPGRPNSLDITIYLSWDYAQQIQLSHLSQQEVNYLIIKESELVGKEADTVISLVHNYFELHGLGEKINIIYCFMVAEHTKFSPDGFFGLIKFLLKESKVDNFEDLIKVVEDSTPGEYNIAQNNF